MTWQVAGALASVGVVALWVAWQLRAARAGAAAAEAESARARAEATGTAIEGERADRLRVIRAMPPDELLERVRKRGRP